MASDAQKQESVSQIRRILEKFLEDEGFRRKAKPLELKYIEILCDKCRQGSAELWVPEDTAALHPRTDNPMATAPSTVSGVNKLLREEARRRGLPVIRLEGRKVRHPKGQVTVESRVYTARIDEPQAGRPPLVQARFKVGGHGRAWTALYATAAVALVVTVGGLLVSLRLALLNAWWSVPAAIPLAFIIVPAAFFVRAVALLDRRREFSDLRLADFVPGRWYLLRTHDAVMVATITRACQRCAQRDFDTRSVLRWDRRRRQWFFECAAQPPHREVFDDAAIQASIASE